MRWSYEPEIMGSSPITSIFFCHYLLNVYIGLLKSGVVKIHSKIPKVKKVWNVNAVVARRVIGKISPAPNKVWVLIDNQKLSEKFKPDETGSPRIEKSELFNVLYTHAKIKSIVNMENIAILRYVT